MAGRVEGLGGHDGGHDAWRATRIFVSHSHADNAFGLRLVADLRRVLGSEESVWYDAAGGLQGGDAWWRTIREELTQRPVFLVLLSPASMDSIWVNNEIDMAWAQRNAARDEQGHPAGKRILPVLVEASQVRADLATLHEETVSFLPPATYEASLRALLDRLGVPPGAEFAAPPAPPAPSAEPNGGDGFVLAREKLAPDTQQRGMSRRTVLAVGGTVAAVAVVGGFADLLLTHGAKQQGTLGARPATATTTTASGTPKTSPRVRWQTDAGVYTGGQYGQLVVGTGNVICFGDKTGAYALDASTGHQRWHFTGASPLEGGYDTYMALSTGDRIILGGGTDPLAVTVYALDAASGTISWTQGSASSVPLTLSMFTAPMPASTVYAMRNPPPTSPDASSTPTYALRADTGAKLGMTQWGLTASSCATDGDVLIDYAGVWYGYDASTLQQRWIVTQGPGTADLTQFWRIVLVAGVAYVLTGDGYVTAVRAADGSLLWQKQIIPDLASSYPFGQSPGPAILTSGRLLLVAIPDGRIYAVDTQTASVIWTATPTKGSFETYTLPVAPAVDNKYLYVAGDNGFLYALDLQHGGQTRWVSPQLNSFACPPAVDGGIVCAADGNGTIYGFYTND